MSSNKIQNDNKFYIQFSLLLILIFIASVVLYNLSLKTKKQDESRFLIHLSEIEGDLSTIEFVKKVEKKELVVIKKDLAKEIELISKEPLKKRENINSDIKPAKESVINIQSRGVKKKKIYKKSDYLKLTRLENRFNNTHDYKIALKLSKKYFFKKLYKKSLKWSMIANELNDSDERSWIMFAKSKVKLGDKISARSALLIYSKQYNSKKVQKILSEMS